MLKKLIAALFTIAVIQTCFAQMEKPDFVKIEKAINDKNSPFFYTTLLKRYTDNDTTLTNEEYRYLYYGFSFRDTYSPYGKPSVNEELRKAIDDDKTDKIIELEKKALTEFPFNLGDLFALARALEKNGAPAGARLYDKKLVGVAKAILSTGSGDSDSTAMYVISVDHEYDLISLLGYRFGNSQALVQTKEGPTDKMKLEKNDDNLQYLYFNVERLFASMDKLFKKKG